MRMGFVIVATTWATISSLCCYPHGISYFNELAGGSANGWKYLLDSNVDWGQDLYRAKEIIAKLPADKSLYVAEMGFIRAQTLGLKSKPAWRQKQIPSEFGQATHDLGPLPGYYLVSIACLKGRDREYRYLEQMAPVGKVGYSMWIFCLSPEDCDALRNSLGIPTAKTVENDFRPENWSDSQQT